MSNLNQESSLKDFLQEEINKLELSPNAKKALFEIAFDIHGYEYDVASNMIASLLDIVFDESNQILVELTSKGYLILHDDLGDNRLYANYEKISIDEDTKSDIFSLKHPFEV